MNRLHTKIILNEYLVNFLSPIVTYSGRVRADLSLVVKYAGSKKDF